MSEEVTIPTTTNLGLKKPGYTNFADIKDAVDDNMDILDAAFGVDAPNGILDKVYPVGSIYMSVVNTNPGTLFGGTWTALGGRFLIGADSTYSAGATGGSATKTLATGNLPSHSHGLGSHVHSVGAHSHGLNGHTHSYSAPANHTHGLSNGAAMIGGNNGYLLFGQKSAAFNYSKAARNTFVSDASGSLSTAVGLFGSTDSGGGSTGATTGGASGSTANSSAFNTGAASGNTGATGSGSAFNIMPPYLSVYMWKRTA